MKRVRLLRTISLTLVVFLVSPAAGADILANDVRPNVLLICLDDLRPFIGAFGCEDMHTPNLDKLAAEGLRFTRATTTQPICAASRSCLLSGTRVTMTKWRKQKNAPEGMVLLPEYFRRHGYYTASVGKVGHGWGQREKRAWDLELGKGQPKRDPKIIEMGGKQEDVDWVKKGNQWGPGSLIYQIVDEAPETMSEGRIADSAIEVLEKRPSGQPLFLAVGFWKPHTPWIAPRRYFDLYPLETITMPKPPKHFAAEVPELYREDVGWPTKRQLWWEGIEEDEARKLRRAYKACVSYTDDMLGRVIQKLEDEGLRDNTIIIAWGDHGYSLGEKGLWRKYTMYQESSNLPLIFAGPGIRQGVTSEMVETVDLYATLADLCGLPMPRTDGVSFKGLLSDTNAKGKQHVFFCDTSEGRAVQRGNWVYAEDYAAGFDQPATARFLWDLSKEQPEWFNLADDPQHAKIVKTLATKLQEHWFDRSASAEQR